MLREKFFYELSFRFLGIEFSPFCQGNIKALYKDMPKE